MFQCEPVFTSNLYYKYLHVDNNAIIKDCLAVKSRDSGRKLSNSGGYQSNDLDRDNLIQGHCFSLVNLIDTIQENILQLPQYFGPLCLDNAWININNHGDSNVQHSHNQSQLAGTYYVTASNENNGQLCFIRNRSEGAVLENLFRDTLRFDGSDAPELSTSAPYNFASGSLIIFPGHLEHRVDRNETNEPRFSISFNIMRTP